jgi:hypothetical protein
MNFAGNISRLFEKENYKGTGEKEQGTVLCSFFKREIVILVKAKKGGYEVNEFKRKISSE